MTTTFLILASIALLGLIIAAAIATAQIIQIRRTAADNADRASTQRWGDVYVDLKQNVGARRARQLINDYETHKD